MDKYSENLKYRYLSEVKERIGNNYKFIKELEKLISYESSDLKKLDLITLIGHFYSLYVTGVYASLELENEIAMIGRNIQFQKKQEPKKNQLLIVMTASGVVGGHSVLVNNWIRWNSDKRYSVAFTDQDYKDVVAFIKESVEFSGGEIYCLKGDYFSKAKELLDISQDYEKILLFTHMYDVIPVLAYGRKKWKIPVLFYNHADFRFSFGFSIADRVLDMTYFDKDKTERFRGVPKEKTTIMQFPNSGNIIGDLEDECANTYTSDKTKQRHILAEKFGFDENEKLIVSAGADFKYENILGYEFDNFVNMLLDKCNYKTSFLIIGANSEKEKWKRLCDTTYGKGRALGILPRQDMEELIGVADLYIVSFPMAASGARIAEKAGVPYLALFITEREVDTYGSNTVRTIDELINKSLDTLNGNGSKYLGHLKEHCKNKEEWCSEWNNVLDEVNEHSIMPIHPQRHIETQEYVNCQLMQDIASDDMARYLYSHKCSQQLQEQIFYLDNKYGMNIFNRMEVLKKDITISTKEYYSNKHLQLYLMAIKWLQVKQIGKHIEDYLLDKGYSTIAIYGMSYMGSTLLNDLIPGKIYVKYGIDAKADKITSDIQVYFPKDELPKADVIINTTVIDNDVIREGLKCKDIKLISLKQMLDDMLEL
ncbi:MAG: hypothetical protein J6D08_09170 [Lachnospiraceae bacterium]|nr:hypothetical protein [Lachnospiraceae bacterium]